MITRVNSVFFLTLIACGAPRGPLAIAGSDDVADALAAAAVESLQAAGCDIVHEPGDLTLELRGLTLNLSGQVTAGAQSVQILILPSSERAPAALVHALGLALGLKYQDGTIMERGVGHVDDPAASLVAVLSEHGKRCERAQ